MRGQGPSLVFLLVLLVAFAGCVTEGDPAVGDGLASHPYRIEGAGSEPVVAEFEGRFSTTDDAVHRLPPPVGDPSYARVDVTEWLPQGVPVDARVWAQDETGRPLQVALQITPESLYHAEWTSGRYRVVRAAEDPVFLTVYLQPLVPPRDGGYTAWLEVVPHVDRLAPQVPVEVTLPAAPVLKFNATGRDVGIIVWGPDDQVVYRERFLGDRTVRLKDALEGRYVLAAVGDGSVGVTGLATSEVRALPLKGEAGAVRAVSAGAETSWTEEVARAPLGVSVGRWFAGPEVSPTWWVEHGGTRVVEEQSDLWMAINGVERRGPGYGWTRDLDAGTYTFGISAVVGHGEAWSYFTYYDRG